MDLYYLKCCAKMLFYDAGYLVYGLIHFHVLNMLLVLNDITTNGLGMFQVFYLALYISFVIVSKYLTGQFFNLFEKGN